MLFKSYLLLVMFLIRSYNVLDVIEMTRVAMKLENINWWQLQFIINLDLKNSYDGKKTSMENERKPLEGDSGPKANISSSRKLERLLQK